MALIECPECKNIISDQASACPKCGFPMEKLKMETQSYAECLKKIEQNHKEEAEKSTVFEDKKKKVKKASRIVLLAALACVAVILLITLVIVPAAKKASMYNEALQLNEKGDYAGAYSIFAQIKGYKDVDSILVNDKNISAAAARDAAFSVGNTVMYGNYQNEDIEWQVLKREGEKALLISKYCLDFQPYNTEWTDAAWETCSLRSWLNGTFYNSAFNSEEQKNILTTTVTADKNPDCDTDPGNDTEDRVFLLSIQEAETYFKSDAERKASPTEYAGSHRAYGTDNGNCWWWLRSPGFDSSLAANVNYDGYVYTNGDSVYYDGNGVRPALWVDITNLAS